MKLKVEEIAINYFLEIKPPFFPDCRASLNKTSTGPEYHQNGNSSTWNYQQFPIQPSGMLVHLQVCLGSSPIWNGISILNKIVGVSTEDMLLLNNNKINTLFTSISLILIWMIMCVVSSVRTPPLSNSCSARCSACDPAHSLSFVLPLP